MPPKATPKPTSKVAIKRKAEAMDASDDDDFEVVEAKRVAPISREQQEADAAMQFGARMHKRYTKYPSELRLTIEKATKTAFHTYMSNLLAGELPTHPQPYNIVIGARIRSQSLTFSRSVHQSNILDLNVANIALLEYFATSKAASLRDAEFVELETVKGLKNPEFIGLHSTRRNEVGWGLDCEGCVSLYVAKLKEKRLEEFVWYVEKGGIKIEDEG